MIQELNVNNFDQEINKDKPVVAFPFGYTFR